jgi:hypothetical protein
MKMQIEVSPDHTVSIRKTARAVNVAEWPEVSLAKVFAYGLQQLLNDAAAPAKTPAEVEGFVTKRIDNLANGVLRAATIRVGDPVEREANRIAREMVLAAFKKAGKSPKGQDVAGLTAKLLAKNPGIRETAKANVAAVTEMEIEVEV